VDIVLFTDKPGLEKKFDPLKRSRKYTLMRHPRSELRAAVKELGRGAFLYIDLSGMKEDERERTLRFASRLRDFRYGIIDTEGVVRDVAALLHNGASDYVNGRIVGDSVTPKRIAKAVQLHPLEPPQPGKKVKTRGGLTIIPSGSDWSVVRSGQEYTFGMMYIELDDQLNLKNKHSDSQIIALMESFKRFIDRSVAHLKGRIWIWNDLGGLVLFPFDGKRCDGSVVCLRLMLSQRMFSVEESGLDRLFSYRIAFHLGNTVFRNKGETGTIVSKSINTIYHLGQKYVQPGQFYITEEALNFTPEKLRGHFIPVGNYEGHDIFRMKLPQ
jgi:hypothetical protein